jgi:predicted transcriptional regulator
MKTTIELPDAILERTKIAAARRRTTMKNLVIQGLEAILREEAAPAQNVEALARLREGYHLGGRPLTREEIHAR